MLLAGIVGAGIWYFNRPPSVTVDVAHVARGKVAATAANTRVGTVKACRRSYLAPAVGGQVARLTVSEGSRVDKGRVLLEIWNQDLRAQMQLAEANSATNEVKARETCLIAEGAEREARRLLGLKKGRLVSEEQVDRAVTDAGGKRAACEAARAAVKASESSIAVAQAALDRTVLRAPFAGVVAEVNAELGEFVTPSPTGIPTLPVIDLLDLSCLYVSAPIDEVDAPAIRTGMNACVKLDAFPRWRCSGTVRRLAPYVLEREKQARTMEVEVQISDPHDLDGLLPGYSADIEVFLDVHDDTLRIPTQAVLESNRVLLYEPSTGRLAERRFVPGIANWDYTEVLSGLQEGEQIVLSVGRDGVKAGVKAVPKTSSLGS